MKTKIFIFLLAVGIIILLISVPRLIKINTIECASQYGPCSDYLNDEISSLDKTSLKETKNRINDKLDSTPIVSEYNMQFQLPDILRVNVKERKLSFALKHDDKYFISDSDGNIIVEMAQTNLPGIEIKNCNCSVGSRVENDVLFALEIAYDMNYQYGVLMGQLSNEDLRFSVDGGNKVIFPTEGDREVLMGALSVILSQLNDEGLDTRIEIDLRFKNPVIRKIT